MLGLGFCARAFSSCGQQGPLFIAVRGPLTVAASLAAEHRLQMRRLSNCGSRAQLLRGMWDLPRPGLEPVSPASAGRFSTTAPPGKPQDCLFLTLASFSPLWLKSHYMFVNFSFMDFLTMILLLKERKIIHSPITLILFKTVFVFTLFFLFSVHKLMYSDTIIIIV